MGIFDPSTIRDAAWWAGESFSVKGIMTVVPTDDQSSECRDCSVQEPQGLNQPIIDPGSWKNMRTQFTPEDARRFYDQFGSMQDTQGFYENPALDDLVNHADFEHAHSILEFGCGTGSFARRLLETVLPADAHYLGLDISGTMIGLATKRLEPWQDRTEARQTDGTPGLPMPDDSFDRFLATYVFDLLDPAYSRQLIAEAFRVLIPGGLLCTVNLTPGSGIFSRLVSRLWTSISDRCPRLVGGCRPINLTALLEPKGWRILHHRSQVSFGICSEIIVAERLETV
jgi:ubiquinone/menaquinone biosynthesis C-methylase UbiE